jgi:PAS domain S-box-containing protein
LTRNFPFITAAGNKKWVRLIGIPIFEGTAGVDLYGLVQDITQKNQAMRAIALQEEQFRQTFDYAPNGIALVSLDGKWLRVNSALCEMVGYSSEELLDLSFQDITHPDDLKKDLELVQEMLAGKRQSYLMEKRYFHKSGESIWASLSVSIVRNPKGKPLYFVSQITDITRNKLLELRLRESNRRMLGILNASTRVGIVETDHLGIIQLFNLGAQNLLGYSEEEVVRKKSPEVFYTPQEITARKEKLALRSQRVLNGFELLTYHLREHPYEVGGVDLCAKKRVAFSRTPHNDGGSERGW